MNNASAEDQLPRGTGRQAPPPRDREARANIEEIYQEIRRRICTLRYPFNAILREAELGEEFGVSRTPIREVMQRLKTDGLIETLNGVGNIVIAGDPETFEDIYSLRIEIAELLGRLSPNLCDPQSIDKLQDLLNEVGALQASPDADTFWDINERRHQIINSMIGNAELAKLHDLYYHKVAPFWFVLASDDLAREAQMLEVELDEMIVWMKSGDVKSVANIHRNHTSYGMIRAQSHLRKRDELT